MAIVTELRLQMQCLFLAQALDTVFYSNDKKLFAYLQKSPGWDIRKHLTNDYTEAIGLNALILDHAYGAWELRYFSGSGGGEAQFTQHRMPKSQLYEAIKLATALVQQARNHVRRDTRRTRGRR